MAIYAQQLALKAAYIRKVAEADCVAAAIAVAAVNLEREAADVELQARLAHLEAGSSGRRRKSVCE